jgi:hypothetical protein
LLKFGINWFYIKQSCFTFNYIRWMVKCCYVIVIVFVVCKYSSLRLRYFFFFNITDIRWSGNNNVVMIFSELSNNLKPMKKKIIKQVIQTNTRYVHKAYLGFEITKLHNIYSEYRTLCFYEYKAPIVFWRLLWTFIV